MVDELARLVPSFDGDVARARCFNHIVNLVAKSLLRPFDVNTQKPKSKAKTTAEPDDDTSSQDEDEEEEQAASAKREPKISTIEEAEKALAELAEGLEDEGLDLEAGVEDDGEDDVDGWVDEVAELSETARAELGLEVLPVKRILVKVRDESSCDAP